jgi:hypothetical protein
LKRWKRDWKIELIEKENLEWRDLSDLIVDIVPQIASWGYGRLLSQGRQM